MSKIKIVKQKKQAINIEDYKNILNGLSGDKKFVDQIVVLDKYYIMKEQLIIISKLLSSFNKTIIKNYSEQDFKMIDEFIRSLDDLKEDKDIQLNNIIDIYYDIKNSEGVAEILNILKCLNPYHKELDKDNFKDICPDFILDNLCDKLQIFSFGSLNIIDVYIRDDTTLNYLIIFLNKLYHSCKEIYKLMTTPDINTQVIADVVLNAIAQLKTKIKGCDKAFNKIEHSMDKILKNMNKYYKMMMVTKDPTAIFTGFLGDLSNDDDENDDIDLATIMQVKTIMSEFKKMTYNNPNRKNNPQIDGLFDDIDNIFTMLENEINE